MMMMPIGDWWGEVGPNKVKCVGLTEGLYRDWTSLRACWRSEPAKLGAWGEI